MSEIVWRDDEVIISTYIGPIRGARGPRTRVQIVLATPTHGNAVMSLDLVQWESLCNAVRDLGSNPHHRPPIDAQVPERTLSLPEPVGYTMPDGSTATRMDFIRAKLGTGPWPIEAVASSAPNA